MVFGAKQNAAGYRVYVNATRPRFGSAGFLRGSTLAEFAEVAVRAALHHHLELLTVGGDLNLA